MSLLRDPTAWPALALSLVLAALGLVFITAPRWGAAIFGLPPPEGAALAYIPVVGLRDLAFAGYLAGLLWRGDRAGARLVLAVTLLIPLGDLTILLAVRGTGAGWHLLPHAASAAAVAAAWRILRAG
ncbi:DUF4267 domain-containing protein [Dankookia sp. P2]|uniref:DUF4267 domain-containing protein n=1 Tax=Dankookia sp. P2 TaxID=3423955 RepID=UPI003D66A79B